MSLKFNITLILSFIFLFSLTACKREHKKIQKDSSLITNTQQTVELMVFPVPTPYEISDIIKKNKLNFTPELLNKTVNYKKYLTTKSQSLNIGVYGADLSYANVFGNGALVREYFDIIKKLSDELGLTLLFTDDFFQRIDDNINNTDSLYKIATESYYKTYSYLVDRGKSDVASAVLTGAFVEGLYLAFRSAEQTQNPQNIYEKVTEQKFASQQLVSLLSKDVALSDLAKDVLEMIRPIEAILRRVRYVDDKPIFKKKDIELLRSVVYKTRKQIINMQ